MVFQLLLQSPVLPGVDVPVRLGTLGQLVIVLRYLTRVQIVRQVLLLAAVLPDRV